MPEDFLYTFLGFLIIIFAFYIVYKIFSFLIKLAFSKSKTAIQAKIIKKSSPNKYIENILTSPKRVLHGTSLNNAREILKTKMWLISEVNPRGVFVTTDFEIARSYAEKKGAIVDIKVKSGTKLIKFTKYHDEGVYLFEIPDGKPFEEYYKIRGLEPVGLLNYSGERIQ